MKMKREDEALVSSKIKGVWKGQYECLMNTETAGKAILLSMGMEASLYRDG